MQREKDILNIIEIPVKKFESIFGEGVIIDITILDECFYRVDAILENAFSSCDAETSEMNEFKLAGVTCFWIRKLKPFRFEGSHKIKLFINEMLAFLIGYSFVLGYLSSNKQESLHIPKISERYLTDLIKSLRYNSYSPHCLVQLFEGLSI
ncbi:MAG: hypothetical protein HQK77_21590 [Desulfobacterales bacterium]|nr:hypothetical protein [Desulfobacterales bacterium]